MVRPETYYLNPLECTTSDGVVNVFREIAVISRSEEKNQSFTLFVEKLKMVWILQLGKGDRAQSGANLWSWCKAGLIHLSIGHLVFVLLHPIIKGNMVYKKKNKYQVLLYDRVTEGIQAFCANHSIDEVFNTKFINLKESVQVGKLFKLKQQLEGGSQSFQTLLKLHSF